ncbi:PcnA [Moumouvirus maliensis]|nr:PcnA [Moumouvirus maliensis]
MSKSHKKVSKVSSKESKKESTKESSKESKLVKSELKKSSKSDKKDNKILEIKTTQTGPLKQVIERISNVISDCCIVFIPPDNDDEDPSEDDDYLEDEDSDSDDSSNKNSKKKSKKKSSKKNSKSNGKKKNPGGIRILRLTEDKSILIKIVLNACNFEYFRCDEPKITIGVDMHILHGLLKMINDDDPIILYMKRDCRSTLYIKSSNENNGNDNSEETEIELSLMEIPNPEMPVPTTQFQNKITMKSDKFHNICKYLNNNSTFVEIKSINNEIIFVGKNEGGKVTMSCRDTEYNFKDKDPNQVVQGMYELRNLLGFSKCNKLCNTIELYLKNDFPLVLVISVATLGKMYVFLSPIDNGDN